MCISDTTDAEKFSKSPIEFQIWFSCVIYLPILLSVLSVGWFQFYTLINGTVVNILVLIHSNFLEDISQSRITESLFITLQSWW